MTTPIEALMSEVDWKPAATYKGMAGDIPYATHFGVLKIGGTEIRCYRLNDGRAILNAEDNAEVLWRPVARN